MSQHDFNIANQGFAAFRADLNNALVALATTSSGTAEPATTYANQLWYETDTNTLHIRNEANSAWLDLMLIDQTTGSPSFTAGNVGIGTTSPLAELHVNSGAANLVGLFESTDSGASITLIDDATTGGSVAEHGLNTVGDQLEVRAVGNVAFETNGVERVRIDSAGNVGIGTDTPAAPLHVVGGDVIIEEANAGASAGPLLILRRTSTSPADDDNLSSIQFNGVDDTQAEVTYARIMAVATDVTAGTEDGALTFWTIGAGAFAERARIDGNGDLLVGKTSASGTSLGFFATSTGLTAAVVGTGAGYAIFANRQNDDGVLITLRQANTQEGTISVSGTTVSYNGGHLSRWAQTIGPKDDTLVKGTVLSNLNDMNVYVDADGNPVDNEQLNKVKVSDVEGDANVAGVFVNWTYDDQHNVDEINMAMTGDMVIRIAGGTTVQRGDLLMSAGDGTAKPQGDDIVRSKTIAKVTSTHVSHTYADGSYTVPCVLMAC